MASYECPECHETFETSEHINRGWHFLAETDGKEAWNVQHGTPVKCGLVLQIHTGHNAGK